ncbi:MAG: putative motility protein, partial [Spirochaetes bacterium]|nr:putative motility protein [Spirochaetota bacterium]
MDIAKLSMQLSQWQLAEAVGGKVQKLALSGMEEQGQQLQQLLASAPVVQDPALGNSVN